MTHKLSVLALILALFLIGCGDGKETITILPGLEGMWHRHAGNVEFIYEFRETGALTVEAIGLNEILYTNRYTYYVDDGLLLLYDYEDGIYSRYNLAFPTDSTATLDMPKKRGFTMTLIRM